MLLQYIKKRVTSEWKKKTLHLWYTGRIKTSERNNNKKKKKKKKTMNEVNKPKWVISVGKCWIDGRSCLSYSYWHANFSIRIYMNRNSDWYFSVRTAINSFEFDVNVFMCVFFFSIRQLFILHSIDRTLIWLSSFAYSTHSHHLNWSHLNSKYCAHAYHIY